MRPVERARDRTLLLLEDELDRDALDRERPGARDRGLFASSDATAIEATARAASIRCFMCSPSCLHGTLASMNRP